LTESPELSHTHPFVLALPALKRLLAHSDLNVSSYSPVGYKR
jgi:hypothetical protein